MLDFVVSQYSYWYLGYTDYIPTEIIPNVWLASAGCTSRTETFRKYKITNNLIVYQWKVENVDMQKLDIDVKQISVEDDDHGNVGKYWDEAYQYIEYVLTQNEENRALKIEIRTRQNMNNHRNEKNTYKFEVNIDDESIDTEKLSYFVHGTSRYNANMLLCNACSQAELEEPSQESPEKTNKMTKLSVKSIKQDEKKRLLINCIHGHSRSASVVIYYLMRKYKMRLKEAYFFVNERRIVWPKFKIMEQLYRYQQENLVQNKEQEDHSAKEFEELIYFIKDQKWKLAGKDYKVKFPNEKNR